MKRSSKTPWFGIVAFIVLYALVEQLGSAFGASINPTSELTTFLAVAPLLVGIVGGYIVQKLLNKKSPNVH